MRIDWSLRWTPGVPALYAVGEGTITVTAGLWSVRLHALGSWRLPWDTDQPWPSVTEALALPGWARFGGQWSPLTNGANPHVAECPLLHTAEDAVDDGFADDLGDTAGVLIAEPIPADVSLDRARTLATLADPDGIRVYTRAQADGQQQCFLIVHHGRVTECPARYAVLSLGIPEQPTGEWPQIELRRVSDPTLPLIY